MDNYTKQLIDFKKMLENRVTYALNQIDNENFDFMDNLYKQEFELTFMGKKCKICFGAEEQSAIIDLLEFLIDE